jgi:large subunit ribosomal protein L21
MLALKLNSLSGLIPCQGNYIRDSRYINTRFTKGLSSMYAVIKSGGKQHRVEPGEVLRLEKLDAETGAIIDFDRVMMIGEGEQVKIGEPYVDGGKVSAEIMSHGRGNKITVIKMKRRKHYRRQAGHRQSYTEIKITEIVGG